MTGYDFASMTFPRGMTSRQKNASPAGQRAQRRYRDGAGYAAKKGAEYLSRPFVAWDGEGVTEADGTHRYVLLANSQGGVISDPDGLSTDTIFDFVLSYANVLPNAVHVIYGGGYDFNKWMSDFTEDELRDVYSRKRSVWRDYRIAWRRGKSFTLADADKARSIILYDVVSFFQTAFVKACDSYLGDAFTDRDMIVENKALRSAFSVDDLPEVIRYNEAELTNLVALMRELRARLHKVDLKPGRWDGPGAIATALLKREKVDEHLARNGVGVPDGPASAARYAYAGGRFEVVRFGHVDAPAYEYDINSAYPAALRDVPSLSLGRWKHVPDDPGHQPYAMYHVDFDGESVDWSLPFPLFRRSAMGNISYPQRVRGWYWSPEVAVARRWCELTGATMRVEEAWVYEEDNDAVRPFGFVDGLYLKRAALKRGGDGAHVGIKLALNSLYGKLAQQVGWEPARNNKPLRLPPFHQLEWAGYVTSHARSQVLQASLSSLDSIIAYETDAVFSSSPLRVPIGSALGEWEATEFTSLTYLQSGLYFGTLADGTEVAKTRGVDRGSLTRQDCLTGLSAHRADERVARAQLSRFVGAGIGLSQDFAKWGRWETVPKTIQLTPQGKRTHEFGCSQCLPPEVSGNTGETLGVWHTTVCPRYGTDHESQEFPVEWINPNPRMQAAALRERAQEDKEATYE